MSNNQANKKQPIEESRLYKIAKVIDKLSITVGRIIAWVVVFLIFMLVHHVILRYIVGRSTPWSYELTYMIYGTHFLIGSGYALCKGQHIGVDFLYRKFSTKWQGRIMLIMYLFVFFPGLILFFDTALDFALRSWGLRETSALSPWAPPLYPFKFMLPLSLLLLMIQGISETIKSYFAAKYGRWV